MLPIQPEMFVDLKSRYSKALERIWDVRLVAEGVLDAPSGKREHVFDFKDGLRLIVSRDHIGPFTCVHVSASHTRGLNGIRLLNRATTAFQDLDEGEHEGTWEVEYHAGGEIVHMMLWPPEPGVWPPKEASA